jgi:sigma-B regulation protein RsbU (phosphoserine phosphatase)
MIHVRQHVSPHSVLDAVHFDFATRRSSDPRKCGGDFVAYDIGTNFLSVAIGDASAKEDRGLKLAEILRRGFRASAVTASPKHILLAMSRTFIEQASLSTPSPTFAAVLVITIDLVRGRLIYAAAGVEGGLVFAGHKRHRHLGSTGPLIGIENEPEYQEEAIPFWPGDILLAYTDGVTEALAARDARPFGSLGLVRLMRDAWFSAGLTSGELCEAIDRYTGLIYHDDATLAVVTASGAPAIVPQLRAMQQPSRAADDRSLERSL